MLFDLKFLKSLKILNIIAKRFFKGQKLGHRKSVQRGASLEFAEYKKYQHGDDLRFIDWNLYGRFETLYIKKFHNQESLNVSILLDCSQSMNFGNPSKFDFGRKMAAAISFIALQYQDSVRIFSFSDEINAISSEGFRPSHIHNLMGFLEKCSPASGNAPFESIAEKFLAKNKRPGVVFVISDCLFEKEVEIGLKKIKHKKNEINLVQILSREEVNPELGGLVELIDSETSSILKVQINKNLLMVYEEILRERFDEMRSFVKKMGMKYHRAITDSPFEASVLSLFGHGGTGNPNVGTIS
ncbi:MAG: DUF58 domain-containing protein [Candidatus Riflebacteria bacterium]|nr:DUF58 domain-containing protein [Candidatus Riflebacteria bacterium]